MRLPLAYSMQNNIDILDMPQAIDGMKNQVIVQRAHRYEYDRAPCICVGRG